MRDVVEFFYGTPLGNLLGIIIAIFLVPGIAFVGYRAERRRLKKGALGGVENGAKRVNSVDEGSDIPFFPEPVEVTGLQPVQEMVMAHLNGASFSAGASYASTWRTKLSQDTTIELLVLSVTTENRVLEMLERSTFKNELVERTQQEKHRYFSQLALSALLPQF